MKVHFRSGEKRSDLSALMMVVAVLMVGALAKLGASMQLFHLAH
jgi:hypothetical protein